MRGLATPSIVAALGLAAVLPFPPVRPPSATAQDESLEERVVAQAELATAHEELDTWALVVGIGREPLVALGHGRAPGPGAGPVDPDTRFPVGALDEAFVATGLLQLVDDGELALDARVASLIPELADWEQPVTVSHLLSHRSGLPHLHDLVGRGPTNRAAILAAIPGAQLGGEPGNCFELSNANTFLAGLVLERVSGAPLAERLAARVFEPLGMHATSFCTKGEGETEHVSCHELAGDLAPDRAALAPLGAGCLCSTANDLFRFERALLNGDLLSEPSRVLFRTPVFLGDGTRIPRGLGANPVVLDDEAEGFAFGGGMSGCRVHVVAYPHYELSIVLLSTGEEAPLDRIARRLAREVLELPQPEILDLSITPDELARYAGTYQTGCTQLVMTVEEERLVFSSWDGTKTPLTYQGLDRFTAADDAELRFAFEVEHDRAEAVRIDDHGVEIRAVRIGTTRL